MEVVVLGSGAAIIKEKRASASFLLKISSGESILLDAGWAAPLRLLQAGQDIQKLDHICISHPHADHIGSLMNILQSMLVSGYDVSGDGWEERKRTKPLYLHGYPGFGVHYEALRNIMVPERVEPYKINVLEYKDDKRDFGNLTISGVEVTHVPQFWSAAAFRVDAEGKSVVYSGDCGYDERLTKLAQGADLALFEMSVPPWMYKKGSRPNHISAYECGLIAAKAGVKKLALVHLYDNDTNEAILKDVNKNFEREVIISEDLQRIKV